MKQAILGVDFGLSKINSTLIDLSDGTLISECERQYSWDRQHDNYMDTDPRNLWEISQDVVAGVLSKYERSKIEIRALVLSCFGETIVPVDAEGEHLYPIIGSNDIRSTEEAAAIARDLPEYSAITGGNVNPASSISKLLWIREHKREVFEKTEGFFSLQQYILRKMGLPPVNDYTLAARKMMLDSAKGEWASQITDYLGITAEQLGTIKPSCYIVGEITQYGRIEIGYSIKVAIGGHDACNAALGLGITPDNKERLIGNNAGTWNLMNMYYDRFVNTAIMAPKLTPGNGPIKGSFYSQAAGAVGPVLDWFVRTFCGGMRLSEISRQAVYDATCRVRLTCDPMEGNGVLQGMSLTNTLPEIFTGIMESITFPLKDMLVQFENLSGKQFKAMRICAGGAKADNWVQMKANVLNISMERVSNIQASAVGAAIHAAVGIGAYSDYKEAISGMVSVDKVFDPQPELVEKYQERALEFQQMNVKGPCFFL